MTAIKEKAYAKLNLFLDVLSKRQDGFHDIRTVMHSVSLHDEVTVTVNNRDRRAVKLVLEGNRRLPTDARNLAFRAATLYMEKAAIDADITIKLDKHIPIAAGLAGGSTDAAAVLRCMNRLFKKHFTEKKLLELASFLGSDVPYCLVGGTALCEGRGEKVLRLNSKLHLYTVVAVDNEHVSTPLAYSSLDSLYSDFDGSVENDSSYSYGMLMSAISNGDLSGCELFNIFEKAVLPICPGASSLRARLVELGASHALMSGSGPSVFGIFDNIEAAAMAEKTLREEGKRAYLAETV